MPEDEEENQLVDDRDSLAVAHYLKTGEIIEGDYVSSSDDESLLELIRSAPPLLERRRFDENGNDVGAEYGEETKWAEENWGEQFQLFSPSVFR